MNAKICRLCLKTIDENYINITEAVAKKMIDSLLMKVNLDLKKEPLMCNDCATDLQKSLDFKLMCIGRGNRISIVTSNESNSLNMKEGSLMESENTELTDISENQKMCCLCMNLSKEECFTYLNETKENIFLLTVIQNHIPELNLVHETFIVCKSCHDSLQNIFNFVSRCLDVEEKIKICIQMGETDENGQVSLCNVQKFTIKPIMKSETNCSGIYIEDKYSESEQEFTVKSELKNEDSLEANDLNLNVKREVIDMMLNNDSESLRFSPHPEILRQNNEAMEWNIIDLKTNTNIDLDRRSKLKSKIRNYETDEKSRRLKHKNIHKSQSEVKKYMCAVCSYKTIYKNRFKRHTIIHKSSSEVPTYKCQTCLFTTKYKENVIRHMKVHKNPTELMPYKCKQCNYATNKRSHLNTHMITHRNPEEIKKYTCEICSYETIHRTRLKEHMVTHKSPSEVPTYKCEICAFTTKHKENVNRHMIIHKNPSELTTYRCEYCTYESYRKDTLERHMLEHKDPSKVMIYKCNICPYQTKHKRRLNEHNFIHRSSAEITVIKCEYKEDLPCRPRLPNKDPSKVMVYSCDICSYETGRKRHLIRHKLVHTNPSELIMYRCEKCTFQAKRKDNLKKHMLVHENHTDITMYKCDICSCESKYKSYLKRHMATHKNHQSC